MTLGRIRGRAGTTASTLSKNDPVARQPVRLHADTKHMTRNEPECWHLLLRALRNDEGIER